MENMEHDSINPLQHLAPAHYTDPAELDDVTYLNNVLAEIGADSEETSFVTVFRESIEPGGKKTNEYLERFSSGGFSLDNLKARWGAGKYEIRVYKDGRILTRKVITIAKDPYTPNMPAQVTPALDLSPILAAIQKSNEGVIAGIMALAQSMKQTGPTRAEMLSEMQIMRDMFAPQSGQPAQNFNVLDALKLGAEMAQKGGGAVTGESDNAWVGKVIDMFGPALVPALTGATAEKTHATPRQATLPAPAARPAPVETQPQPQPQPQPEDDPVNGLIYNYLNMLKRAASQNAPVDEYADSILSMVPASNIADLENLLKPADWREQLRKKTTAVEEFPVWFTQLRDTLLLFIEEDRQAAGGGVSANLTPGSSDGSVPLHENEPSTDKPDSPGNPSSVA